MKDQSAPLAVGPEAARKDRPEPRRSRPGRPFPPKNSGKPKGTRDRRTVVGIEVCRAMAGRAADRLAALIDSRSTRIAFESSRLVLAYAWGAPRQTLEFVGDFSDLSRELAAALKYARDERAGLHAAVPAAPSVAAAPGALALPAAVAPALDAEVLTSEKTSYPTSEPAPLLLKESGASSPQEASGATIAADGVEAGHENASATGAQDAAAPGTVAASARGAE